METHIDPYTRVAYCPLCQELPPRPSNPDSLNRVVPVPRICPSCQAKNSQLTAEIRDAKKVRVCAPGESGLDREDQQKSLFNPHRLKKLKANRAKNQPP